MPNGARHAGKACFRRPNLNTKPTHLPLHMFDLELPLRLSLGIEDQRHEVSNTPDLQVTSPGATNE